MEQTNNQHIVGGFIRNLVATQLIITYNGKFMDHEKRLASKETDFMNIVSHPHYRIILKPNEWALTRAEHPLEKYKHTNQVILMRGTVYGIIVMFGPEAQYDQKLVKGVPMFFGPIPKLHATSSFRMMTMRFFKRTTGKALLLGADEQIMAWIFSPNFQKELDEQIRIDKVQGIQVTDGLPPRTRAPHHVQMARTPNPNAKSEQKAVAKPPVKAKGHPLDIIPNRANAFKGTPYSEQTPEQKAAGQAILTPASKREIANLINAKSNGRTQINVQLDENEPNPHKVVEAVHRTYTEVTKVPGGYEGRERHA